MTERLHVIPAGQLLHLADRERPVDLRDVVDGELGPGRRQVDAGPVVEQPHVIAAVSQVFRQVLLDGRRQERVRRHAEPGCHHEGAPVPCPVPRQPQEGVVAEPVVGVPLVAAVAPPDSVRVSGLAHRGRRLRRAGEGARLVQHTAVDVHHLVGEQLEERPPVPILLRARHPVDLDAAQQLGEVGRLQVQDPGARFRPARLADLGVQRRRLRPGPADAVLAQHLVAFEAVPLPLVRHQGHPVLHVPGLHLRGIGLEEREAAFSDGQAVR